MKVKNKIIVCLLIVLILSILNITVYAAASFIVSAGDSMKIGETEKLTISTIDCAGKFLISSSDSTVVSVSSGSVFVDGSVMSNPDEVILTAKSNGTAVITVTAYDVSNKAYEEVTGSKSVTVTVSSPATPTPTPTTAPETTNPEATPTVTATPAPVVKSSNANLKNLGITPNDFSGFTANKTEYYVTVPYEVESVRVYAKKAEASQAISGEGDKSLEIGATTRCAVTVTAEDGTQKTYNIYVTRKSEPTETVPNVVEEPEELLKLSSLEVKNATITPEFNPDIYEYEIELTDDTIEKLDILATANIENASIEVNGNENFMEGENTVTIVLKSEDGTKAATYTITVTKEAVVATETPEPIAEEQETVQEEKKNIFSFLKSGNTGMIVILVIAIIVLLASIVTVVVILIKNRKDSEAEMMSFTPNSEYNVFEEKVEDKKEETETEEKQDKQKRRGKHF